MKQYTILFIAILLATFTLFSCEESEVLTPQEPTSFWGCWTEATGKEGAHDVILTGNASTLHNFTLTDYCGSDLVVASIDVGFFRNDTLILDNGVHEFFCYIKADTMYYSINLGGFEPEKLVKVNN